MTEPSQTKATVLEGCPLCGHPEIEHHTWSAFHYGSMGGYSPKKEQFRCLSCGLEFAVRGDEITKEQAFAKWNTRAATKPQEVTDEEAEEVGYQGVPEHWQSPTARSAIRHAIYAIKRHGLRIVKGAAT